MEVLPGTVIGIRTVDGVVLAGEKRLTYDGFVLSKNVKKIFPVTDRVAVGFAGLAGDINYLYRILRVEAKLYELEHGREIRARSLAKLLSVILYSYKLFPMLTEVVVGGFDEGPGLYVLDPVGSLIEEKYAALGSGSQLALGIIEQNYKEDMSVEDAKNLAVKAILEAIERDVLSGDGVDLLILTREGVRSEEHLIARRA
ncbi:archaeal proteasome endopeptidase complex subunit beta [Thermogladius sp. 4427co]|uniref:archaeal proteasome endopeptidase complex subunit beta n=1 Tax=Thermogladius sp. 4427co TaxID=3450718 RepID=UPI003F7B1CBB